jgi:hypothetical protein
LLISAANFKFWKGSVHKQSRVRHQVRDIVVALANCFVAWDVEAQKTAEAADEGEAEC